MGTLPTKGLPCWSAQCTQGTKGSGDAPSPVMALVGTMLMKERGSRLRQYSATFRPCSFSWSMTCRRELEGGKEGVRRVITELSGLSSPS